MNGIINRTQTARRASLSPGPFVARTAGSFLPQSRQALGQAGYGEYGPEVIPPGILFPEVPPEAPLFMLPEQVEVAPPEYVAAAGIVLQRGSRGDQVRALQTQLRRLGFPAGRVDGIYGPLTEQAVRLFQQSANLPATGMVDEVTWAAIQSAVPAPPGWPIPGPAIPAPVPTPAPTPAPTPEGPLEVPPSMRLPPSIPEAAPRELLGLPVGIWVALGVVVIALIATAAPAPAPSPTARRGILRA